MLGNRKKRFAFSAVPLVAAAMILTACGSSSSSASSSPAAAPASAAASEAASSMAPASLEKKTIGVWQSQGDAAGETEARDGLVAAATAVGWDTIVTDGAGDPAKFTATMESLIAQKVDAIVAVFTATPLIEPQLKAAKDAGIPVIAIGYTGTPSDLYSAMYTPDQEKEADMLLERMGTDLPSGSSIAPIAVQGYFGIDQVLKVLADNGPTYGFDILETVNAPGDDVFAGETKAALDFLNGNPDLGAFYATLDIGTQTIIPALKQTGRDVPIYGFGAIQSALPFARSGQAQLVTSDGTGKSGFVAINSLLDFWVNGTAIPPTTPEEFAFDYKIVDKTNVPAEGEFVYPLQSYAQPFYDAWATEYGITAP